MRGQRRASPAPEVALLLETSTEYGRGLLRGILRYSRLHGPWSLYVAPGHLDQTLPDPELWKGSGLIARIRSPHMERMIRATRLPVVVSSLSESHPLDPGGKFGEIRTDSEAIARMAAIHLMEAGIRSFAFCGFMACHWSSVRERAFVECAASQGYPCSVHRIPVANWMQLPLWMQSWQKEQPITARWLQSLPKPAGLMACNDVCGLEVLQACTSAGIRVPEEVAVVGVDNDEVMCGLSHIPLSSVALDLEKAGYEAASLLDALMAGRSGGQGVVWVEPTHVAVRRSSDVIAQEDPVVARALHFIREHAKEPISVDIISDELHVSRRTLERRFPHAVGRSILSEIMRCHLQRAKLLLLETDMPSYKVAVESGFGSLKSFNRNFTRLEGTTPQKFRQSLKGAATREASIKSLGPTAPRVALRRPAASKTAPAFSQSVADGS